MGRELMSQIGCKLTRRERAAVMQMKAATALTLDADLVRVALYRFALYLDVPIVPADFAVHGPARHGGLVKSTITKTTTGE